jgi:DNA polymerase III epsilon subunit-like protein
MPENTPLIFLDTETSGLDAHRHAIWELAAVKRTATLTEELHRFVRLDLRSADRKALAYGRYHERFRDDRAVDISEALRDLCAFADGGVLLGLNIGFDVRFIERAMFDANTRHAPGARLVSTWHYSPVDVKSLAAGALKLAPPWRSDDIAQALDVNPADFARHGALADCHFSAAIYDAAMALPRAA